MAPMASIPMTKPRNGRTTNAVSEAQARSLERHGWVRNDAEAPASEPDTTTPDAGSGDANPED